MMGNNYMKKILLVFAICLLAMLCIGCDSKSEKDLLAKNADGSITVLDAKIVTEIRGDDGEQIISSSQAPASRVYADLRLYIENNTSTTINGDTIIGGVQYDGDIYSVVFGLENDNATGVSATGLEPGKSGVVHIFASIPDSALEAKDDILAWATIDGADYGMKVSAMNYQEPLNQKKELKVGDKVQILGGKMEVEVISCNISNYITPTKDQTYVVETNTSGPSINVTLRITNNTKNDITELYGYVMKNAELTRATARKETTAGTAFETFNESSPLKAGETRIVHLYGDYSMSSDSKLRFNLLGNAFYIKG